MYKIVLEYPRVNLYFCRCISRQIFNEILTTDIKKEIDDYWFKKCNQENYFNSDDNSRPKFYALSMFPYPSGNLHLGHVRVYTINDVIARFHRGNGKNVFQPIGWDSFGLPAENAAIERGIRPDEWTKLNINHMTKQLKQLFCTFDWQAELSTSSPDYYKWTQFIFLKMYDAGLVYQKESLVNWDPIDCTVLAQEQVDSEGRSWRSGSIVEKKMLKQWFIRTTKFSQDLYNGLNSEILLDWDDIIDIQRHWIGECDGYSFDLKIKVDGRTSETNCLNVWLKDPVSILEAAFILVKPESLICIIGDRTENAYGKLNVEAINPFTGRCLPIFVCEEAPYAFERDVYVGVPLKLEFDREFANRVGVTYTAEEAAGAYTNDEICEKARQWCIGGYPVSSKIQDWPVSRQRYWGTPIPMVHCAKCGTQPIPYDQLPVTLPPLPENFIMGKALNDFLNTSTWKNIECPKCGCNATRDTDTMDTFVDSSWYYLRYPDKNNKNEPFNRKMAQKLLPVDSYVGGKEHALLHLYYARFVSYFLHSIGMIEHREPFRRLLCQGMVKGRTYKTKVGKYLKPDEVLIEGETTKCKETGEILDVIYEKMSKSRYNGVDPKYVIEKYGVDTTRLFLLFSVSPKSHREWDEKLFVDVQKWQNRMWLTLREFLNFRESRFNISSDFDIEKENEILRQYRNKYVCRATYHYKETQELAICVSNLQTFSTKLRSTSRPSRVYCEEFEKCLAALIIMLSPIIPSFAATLWSGLTLAPGRLNEKNEAISWNKSVFEQKWPQLDPDYEVGIYCRVNDGPTHAITVENQKLIALTAEEALKIALTDDFIKKICSRTRITNLVLKKYDNLCADFRIEGIVEKKLEPTNNADDKINEVSHL